MSCLIQLCHVCVKLESLFSLVVCTCVQKVKMLERLDYGLNSHSKPDIYVHELKYYKNVFNRTIEGAYL